MSRGEFELIHRLTSRLQYPKAGVLRGPGDDAAVVRVGGKNVLLTTDLLIENIHFRLDWMTPEEIGFKAMRVNLSDIAAMGGTPRFALVSLGLPKAFRGRAAERLFSGLRKAAAREGALIVGGDTNASDRLIVNVALSGEAGKRVLTRHGARPGDAIYVTGRLGESALGLAALQKGRRSGFEKFIRRHAVPPSRLGVGRALAALPGVHSLMDLSDGLAGDLPHLLEAGRVGADVAVDSLPRAAGFEKAAARLGADGIELLLSGGEDYELLFTAAPRVKMPGNIGGVRVTNIGKITSNPGILRCFRRDGAPLRGGVVFRGFRHF